jgi:hypothetical protein
VADQEVDNFVSYGLGTLQYREHNEAAYPSFEDNLVVVRNPLGLLYKHGRRPFHYGPRFLSSSMEKYQLCGKVSTLSTTTEASAQPNIFTATGKVQE